MFQFVQLPDDRKIKLPGYGKEKLKWVFKSLGLYYHSDILRQCIIVKSEFHEFYKSFAI